MAAEAVASAEAAPEEALRAIHLDAAVFAEHAFGDVLWSKQREVLQAISAHERVAVKSGHGVGKTYLAARAAIWWLATRKPAEVITSAPTWRQVEKLLWKEINLAWAELRIPEVRAAGECSATRLRFAPGHEGYGIATTEPERFQGIHSPHLMVILDEASGIADAIYDAVVTLGTGGEHRELLIGNPVRPEGRFYRAFAEPDLGYHCISIPVTSSPNFTGEAADLPPEVARQLVTPEWVAQVTADWGEGSPLYRARVLAEFPALDAEDVVVPLSWLEAAVARGETWEPGPKDTVQLGVDVARFGRDSTVLAGRCGMAAVSMTAHTGQTPAPQVAGLTTAEAMRLRDLYGRDVLVLVDEGGVGGGALDILQTRNDRGITYLGVQFGGKAYDPDQYLNRRAEMYWHLRNYAQPDNGWPDLVLAAEGHEQQRAVAQLCAMRYHYAARGQVQIEGKDEMRKRQMPSPDEADALALAFARVQIERTETVGMEQVVKGWRPTQLGAARL